MTTTIEHVRHRVAAEPDPLPWDDQLYRTVCGRTFVGLPMPAQDTIAARHHEPATSRCPGCYPA